MAVAEKHVNPKLAKPDPNVASPYQPVPKELTAEEKKAAAEQEKLELEAIDKVAKINTNLVKEGSPLRIGAEVRNGEIVYKWVQTVPTRFLTEEEVKAVSGMK